MRGTRGATRSRGQRLLYPPPGLDLRFAETKSLTDWISGQNLITFTRASSGTYVGSNGVLQTATTNEPRFDHNPTTGESLGLLVEEARTNSVRNNTMVGAVAGTPGTLPTNWPYQIATNGLAVSIVGTGTESGIAYLDWKISGTTTALATADISFGRTAALTGQTWSSSVYVKLVSGSLSAVTNTFIRIVEEDASTNFITGSDGYLALPTSASLGTQRGSFTRTLSGGAATAFTRTNYAVTISSGSTVDITLRIGLPQLEQGAFATSPILTSGAAATRSADVASVNTLTPWFNASEGTLYVEGSSSILARAMAVIDDGSFNNRYQAAIASGYTPNFAAVSGGAVSADIYTSALTQSSNVKLAGAYRVNDFALSANGSAVVTDTSGALPVGLTTLRLGAYSTGGILCGTIRRLIYWPQRLPNNSLVAITR